MASDKAIYGAARDAAEVAATYAASTEALGYVHPNVLAVIQDHNLPQMLKPGSEHSIRDFVHVCGLLAEGCMSTGWCNFVWGMHNFLVARYPKTVQRQVWSDPATLVSASLGPVGTVEVDTKHATLTGRWRFNSGCDHAEWLLLGATSNTRGKDTYLTLVHRSEYEIIDTWQVIGLRGTGSKDAVCRSVQIPKRRMLPFGKVITPYTALLILVIVGPVIGGAAAALKAFTQQLKGRRKPLDGSPLAKQQGVLLRVAEASAEIDAARTVTLAAADALDKNPAPDGRTTARIIRDTAFAAKLANQATRRLFEAAGGSALHESNRLQRIFRDVTAGCAQARLHWDEQAEPYAKILIDEAPG